MDCLHSGPLESIHLSVCHSPIFTYFVFISPFLHFLFEFRTQTVIGERCLKSGYFFALSGRQATAHSIGTQVGAGVQTNTGLKRQWKLWGEKKRNWRFDLSRQMPACSRSETLLGWLFNRTGGPSGSERKKLWSRESPIECHRLPRYRQM